MVKEECQNCKFWLITEPAGVLGVCRRYPPREESEMFKHGEHVGTIDVQWCGEWRVKCPLTRCKRCGVELKDLFPEGDSNILGGMCPRCYVEENPRGERKWKQ